MDSTALAPVLTAAAAIVTAIILVARFKPDLTASAVQTMGEVNDELRQDKQDLRQDVERLEVRLAACREQKHALEAELRKVEESLRMCHRRENVLEARLQDLGKEQSRDR